MRYTEENLLVRARTDEPGLLNRVTPTQAGWEALHFEARVLCRGQDWEHDTAETEAAMVILGTVGA